MRRDIHFNGVKNIGFVDMGFGDGGNDEEASQAIVFMLVGVNNNVRLPCTTVFCLHCLDCRARI